MAILEWVAAGLGLVNIALLVRRSVWNYPVGIAMVALYVFVFWEQRLYAESGLQVFFILAQAWGWWMWQRVGGEGDRVPVRWLDGMSRAVWVVGTAAVSLNLGWVMHRFTDAALPYIDTAIAGVSVSAQILLAFRRVENWVLWIAIDAVAIPLYLNRGLHATAVLYAGMLVMSVLGLREWIAAAKAPAVEPQDRAHAA
nr:nicotinamide riboside transporter PnuC [Novosphingobium sp. Rr 2-17]